MENYIFTSESVTAGHPDKICDYIADSILDEALKQDIDSKMSVEATIKDNLIFLYGETNTKAKINYKKVALNCLKDIGYLESYVVIERIGQQSKEISNAVINQKDEIKAGDQGIMFGYACNETETYMPAPIYYANKLAQQLGSFQTESDFLGLDGKTQVSVQYENGKVKRIHTIVISTQHKKDVDINYLKNLIIDNVILPIIPNNLLDNKTNIIINPSGSFVIGGSFGDSGTTGRKIVCDSYGGMGRNGGGCFSSKDPSKVDRSAAYYCRYVAKNIVANGYASRFEIQVSYAIGHSNPISIYIDSFNTGDDEKILKIINNNFDFNVSSIIKELDLKKPIYKNTSRYGHFGRNEFNWEKIIKIKE